MKERRLPDWIDTYLEYTTNTEPPTSFHRWTAIGSVASALQRRVHHDWGMERIFPNLYIVLLGPAAQTRKSTAIKIGEDMVKTLSIPMIGQDNSPEAVIREIKGSILTFHEGTQIRTQSAVCCFASELAVFLGAQNTQFQAYLTDWYDSPQQWKRTTKHQGIDDITGMCFNLVGAMAPDWIPHVFSPESIGGGFTSRVVFVAESRKAKTVANPNKCLPSETQRANLLHDLECINTLVGPFEFMKEAEDFYEHWYTEDDARIQQGNFPVKDQAFHAYAGRRSTILRKVSMVVSASRGDSRLIGLGDIKTALKYLEEAEVKMPGTFAAVGRSANAHQVALISTLVQARGSIKKSALLRELYKDVSLEDLDKAVETLEGAQMLKVTRLTDEGDTIYEWNSPS